MLSRCDFVTIHVPLMDKTRNYLNAQMIDMMKNGAILLNLARGELVDSEAVLAALESGKLARYVTDFPTEAVIGKPGVICVPHLGASTPESEENCARMASHTLRDYLENGNIVNSVNMPACSMPVTGVCRVCALHKNVTNMVGQITGIVANAGANIANMINQSRGEIAYTLMDLDHDIDENAEKQIGEISGMVRVRVLRYE